MNSKTSTLQNNSHTSIQFPLSKSLASNNTELSGKPVITTVKSDVSQITTCLKKNVSVGFCELLKLHIWIFMFHVNFIARLSSKFVL